MKNISFCLIFYKVIFTLTELEDVEYLLQPNSTSFISPVTLNNQQRTFTYALIGRECNNTWTIFKRINPIGSLYQNIDTNLSLCTRIYYPSSDALTIDDGG